MKQCQSCGGVYAPVLADGMAYFHACPPVRQLLDQTGVPLDAQTADALLKAGQPVYERVVERPDKRDENIVESREPTKKHTVKAEGRGVIDIAAPTDALGGAVRVPLEAPPLVPPRP